MNLRPRIARVSLIALTATAFAASAGSAAAAPGDSGASHRSDNAPGGATTAVDTHRPAGAGDGRKVG